MAQDGKEPTGSMGADWPLAVLSHQAQHPIPINVKNNPNIIGKALDGETSSKNSFCTIVGEEVGPSFFLLRSFLRCRICVPLVYVVGVYVG